MDSRIWTIEDIIKDGKDIGEAAELYSIDGEEKETFHLFVLQVSIDKLARNQTFHTESAIALIKIQHKTKSVCVRHTIQMIFH